ncbi:C39 family peptidase [Methanoculleus sp. 7T]|uniref:C39 family peptidase n=1 Tax=Methanoculleus sp. 7T TaxID=2937282 RepID=UPI0020BFD7FB|nr:C39 family peptidase [Methanoculleus sp. 7T]MCK8518000.1 C39 family peptidase [Methanoculleus sp. 7T]
MDSAQDLSDLVISFQKSKQILGKSGVADYLFRYLSEQNAMSCVIERKYVDKDFLLDYSKYYSRSFRNGDDRFTTRLHFFKCPLTSETFNEILVDGSDEDIVRLNKSYLGFTVIKPINDKDDNPLIGKTLLVTYPESDGAAKRVFIKHTYHVSLFGIDLKVESLPFQTQDSTVGGCATIACWIALHPLSKLFGVPTHSPYEVTERSVSFISLNRNFPSKGLTIYEMKNCFTQIGLDTEFIVPSFVQGSSYDPKYDDITADSVIAYINMGIPVIAAIALKKPGKKYKMRRKFSRYLRRIKEEPEFAYHAVVISGYRHENGRVTELYLHDDGIGPYCRTQPVGNFTIWHNEWVSIRGYESIYVRHLLVPVYPKIRMEFSKIYQAYQYLRNSICQVSDPRYSNLVKFELFLVDMKEYKKALLKKRFDDKVAFLQEPMPRFLWIIRQYFMDTVVFDVIHDATDEREHGLVKIIRYI